MSYPIQDLRTELEDARKADVKGIEEAVAGAGFRCARCQKCCKGAYGDNTVAVSPREIRAIIGATGRLWPDVAIPAEVGDLDDDGIFHSFGWALKKTKGGDCIFLEPSGSCAIYANRPWICRTYPFSLYHESVEVYECDGLGSGCPDDPGPISLAIKERSVAEAEEAVAMLERFERFKPSRRGRVAAGEYIVHDSEGSHHVLIKDDETALLF